MEAVGDLGYFTPGPVCFHAQGGSSSGGKPPNSEAECTLDEPSKNPGPTSPQHLPTSSRDRRNQRLNQLNQTGSVLLERHPPPVQEARFGYL